MRDTSQLDGLTQHNALAKFDLLSHVATVVLERLQHERDPKVQRALLEEIDSVVAKMQRLGQ